jgi:hypothetical protein
LTCKFSGGAAVRFDRIVRLAEKQKETTMELPNRLRLQNGELVMADGSDVREYLRAFAAKHAVTANTPLTLCDRAQAQANAKDAEHWRYGATEKYAFAA